MRLGVNLHADWGGCPNLEWLITNTKIKNVRIDFPCKDTFKNVTMLKQMNNVLDKCSDFENIVLHVGYLNKLDIGAYRRFNLYIKHVIEKLIDKGLARKTILEIWNNVNLGGSWPKGELGDEKDFRRILSFIAPALSLARKNGIRISGFSFTLNHKSGWEWLRGLQDVLGSYDFITVQIYPEKANQYVDIISWLERKYPGLNYIVTETGHHGDAQLCKYRQLMYEIEKATPDKLVFLYHLFDWKDVSHGKNWELINWVEEEKIPQEKPVVKYLKKSFTLPELERDKPDFYCCKKSLWRKIICFFRGL